MIPFPYQTELADEAYDILKKYFIVYFACEERTGKTLAAIITAEKTADTVQNVLVITKKKALEGWHETLDAYDTKKNFTVTNYHQAHKQDKPDLVILDESHNYISSFPKPSAMWKQLRRLCKGVPLIYASATPHAQGPQMMYHQLALSSWSPWKNYTNFYNWFRAYGKPYTVEINGLQINQYDRCDVARVKCCFEHLMISKTRKELGFKREPKDKLHYIELDQTTKDVYNELLEHQIIQLKAGWLVCDTKPKLRYALHMLEGGTAKIDELRIVLDNDEKVRYIKNTFGDHAGLVIMYNYIQEEIKLKTVFKKATILQATSFAEGVDLHKFEDLVIYSQDFSTARHTQRRARQANKKRETPIIVHYLLVKKATSAQVYKTVSVNKKNFVDSVFERTKL